MGCHCCDQVLHEHHVHSIPLETHLLRLLILYIYIFHFSTKDGLKNHFLENLWLGNQPLCLLYPNLSHIWGLWILHLVIPFLKHWLSSWFIRSDNWLFILSLPQVPTCLHLCHFKVIGFGFGFPQTYFPLAFLSHSVFPYVYP